MVFNFLKVIWRYLRRYVRVKRETIEYISKKRRKTGLVSEVALSQ